MDVRYLNFAVIVDPLPIANFTPDVTSGCDIDGQLTTIPLPVSLILLIVISGRLMKSRSWLSTHSDPTSTTRLSILSNKSKTRLRSNKSIDYAFMFSPSMVRTISSVVTITVLAWNDSGFIEQPIHHQ